MLVLVLVLASVLVVRVVVNAERVHGQGWQSFARIPSFFPPPRHTLIHGLIARSCSSIDRSAARPAAEGW